MSRIRFAVALSAITIIPMVSTASASASATAVDLSVAVGSAVAAPSGSAAGIRTFDDEPVGSPPAGATARGTVAVSVAPFGGPGNRAVHLTDASSTGDSSVLFPAAAAPIRRFAVDLAPHQAQPFQIAIHGTAPDGSAAVGYRLSIGPVYNYGRSSAAQVSSYAGSVAQRLAVIPDLTDQDAPTRLEVTASADALVVRVGEFSFLSTERVSALSDITGVEFSSPGVSATGTDVYVDNLSVTDQVDRAELAAGVPTVGLLTSLVAGGSPRRVPVATVTEPGIEAKDISAHVHVGGRWVPAVVSGTPGSLTVRCSLVEPDIGLHPVTVTVTDRRTGQSRSTQMRTQSYAPIPTSVVVQEAPGNSEARFIDALRLQDGRIIVAYHYATAHTQANGVIRVVSSADNGRTWTEPVTVVANEYDNRDPKLAQLRDGTILLTSFRTNWAAAGGANVGTFVFRSTDGGATFPQETMIQGAHVGTYQHAPAVELANGDVLQPLYGAGARIARSTDSGRTFPLANEITVVRDDARYYNREPNLVQLAGGKLVMVIRAHWRLVGAERQSRIVRSFDDGHTWTPPEATDLPTSSHHLLLNRDGSVLLTFGNSLQPDRPTYATLITDPSGPWVGYRQVPAFNAGSGDDQGNPSSVELPDGTFLSFGYDVGERTVVSWRSTSRDLATTPAPAAAGFAPPSG